MRTLAILISLLTFPLSAANLWFDPPNPTSRTPVTAHILTGLQCVTDDTTVSIGSQSIVITLKQFQPCTLPPPLVGSLITADLGVLPAGVYDVVVGEEVLLIGLGEAKLAVADAHAPFTVSPNVAPTTGGDVTITGLTLPACAVGTCAAPLVTFGGSEAQIEEFALPDKLVVYAQAHDAGTVDVVVRYAGQVYTAPAAFNYFAPAGPMDAAFFEPVLFPVMITGPGAFGSNWTTDVTMRNENDYPLPVSSVFDQTCFPVCDARPPAHSTTIVLGANAPNGLLLNVPRQSAPKLFFGTLIRDLSRQSETLGTEIPVVREDKLFDRPFTLLNVPSDPRYRVALRFYRTDGDVLLHYRIRPLSTDETVVDAFAFLAPATPGSQLTVAFIGDLLTRYPQLAGRGSLRIDIDGFIDGSSTQRGSWAFVSVTNNTTQNVTLISPQ